MCIRYIKQRKLSVIKVSFLHVSILFQTMERRLIATARHLTLRLKRGMNAASGTISTVSGRVLPTAVQNRFSQALKYTDDLYNSFSKVWFCWFISFNLVSSERPFSKSELGASKQTICNYWPLHVGPNWNKLCHVQANTLQELPTHVLDHVKDKLGYITESVNFATEYITNLAVVDWLVSSLVKTNIWHDLKRKQENRQYFRQGRVLKC